MTICEDTARQALAYLLDTPRTGRLMARRDRSDFGGEDSYLLKVRRIGRDYPFGDDIEDGDFGLYLGRHADGYVVALQSVFPGDVIGYERYETLAELQHDWELD